LDARKLGLRYTRLSREAAWTSNVTSHAVLILQQGEHSIPQAVIALVDFLGRQPSPQLCRWDLAEHPCSLRAYSLENRKHSPSPGQKTGFAAATTSMNIVIADVTCLLSKRPRGVKATHFLQHGSTPSLPGATRVPRQLVESGLLLCLRRKLDNRSRLG
jgi:hypothetical protein